jgi:hypothetical protein
MDERLFMRHVADSWGASNAIMSTWDKVFRSCVFRIPDVNHPDMASAINDWFAALHANEGVCHMLRHNKQYGSQESSNTVDMVVRETIAMRDMRNRRNPFQVQAMHFNTLNVLRFEFSGSMEVISKLTRDALRNCPDRTFEPEACAAPAVPS